MILLIISSSTVLMVANTASYLNFCFILSTLSSVTNSQLLPGLPDLPSPRPSISDTASTSNTPPSDLSPSASVVPSPGPREPSGVLPPLTGISQENSECVRDVKLPAPTLGTSQYAHALSVVLSSAAIACASFLYTECATSNGPCETDQKSNGSSNDRRRVAGIVFARVLIGISIKISAALVASITNSSPADGVLDASGAFLTWATAVLTRFYYEAIQMTVRPLGFLSGSELSNRQLRKYLKLPGLNSSSESSAEEECDGESECSFKVLLRTHCESCAHCTIYELLFWPRKARLILAIHAFLYFFAESATLIINLHRLINDFSPNAARTLFVPADEAGQCGIVRDLPSK